MFDTQNNAFRKLFEEGKKYINLQIDYAEPHPIFVSTKIATLTIHIFNPYLSFIVFCQPIKPKIFFKQTNKIPIILLSLYNHIKM